MLYFRKIEDCNDCCLVLAIPSLAAINWKSFANKSGFSTPNLLSSISLARAIKTAVESVDAVEERFEGFTDRAKNFVTTWLGGRYAKDEGVSPTADNSPCTADPVAKAPDEFADPEAASTTAPEVKRMT